MKRIPVIMDCETGHDDAGDRLDVKAGRIYRTHF